MIQLLVIGNLGREPETRFTGAGQQVTDFSIASTRKWKNASGEPQKEVTWFKCSAWGKTAEITAQYLHKGSKCAVTGRLATDGAGNPKVFTRKDGTSGASFELTIDTVEFLDSAHTGNGEPAHDLDTEETIPF